MAVINKINDQKNLIEENLRIIHSNSDGKHKEEFFEVKKNVSKKIGFLVNVIRKLKKKITNYKNEA
jgi:hypothetical protein